jgi:hypothetical protein
MGPYPLITARAQNTVLQCDYQKIDKVFQSTDRFHQTH